MNNFNYQKNYLDISKFINMYIKNNSKFDKQIRTQAYKLILKNKKCKKYLRIRI